MPPLLGLLLGVLAVSSAAVLVRLADAPPLVVGAWRLMVAAGIVLPIALALEGRSLMDLGRQDWLTALAAAGLLALHFATWIASLSYTSVASSTVIVTSNPLIVALLAPLVAGDRLRRRAVLGILIALVGGVVIGAGDLRFGGTALLGNGLALAGAAAVAGYYLAGRRLRVRLPVLTYVAVVYPLAALMLAGAAVAVGNTLSDYPPRTLGLMVLVGLLPQVVGHSLLNWSLGYLPAVSVSAAVMAEPIGATVLALLLLEEAPTRWELVGGALVLAGVGVTLASSRPD